MLRDAVLARVARYALAPILYLAAIVFAEVSARLGLLWVGIAVDGTALGAAIRSSSVDDGPDRAFGLAIAVVALQRLLSLSALIVPLDGADRYIVVGALTVIGLALVVGLADFSADDLGLVINGRVAFVSALVVPLGLMMGFIYYSIAEPFPLVTDARFAAVLGPSLLLTLTSGLLEEVLFRGFVQRAASARVGTVVGAVYTTVLSALLVAGPVTLPATAAVFVTSSGLTVLRSATGSVLPGAAAHACLSIALLLIAPFARPGGIFG